jgi:hypothetical protein
MRDIKEMLMRRAEWQNNRTRQPWPDKIRQVEAVLDTARWFQDARDRARQPKKGQPPFPSEDPE